MVGNPSSTIRLPTSTSTTPNCKKTGQLKCWKMEQTQSSSGATELSSKCVFETHVNAGIKTFHIVNDFLYLATLHWTPPVKRWGSNMVRIWCQK